MPNDNISSSFPETRKDIGKLRDTAVDAATDLASTASTHANKAKGQVQKLASHAQDEAMDQVGQIGSKVGDLADLTRDYVLARPLTCLGVALAAGFLFGLSRRS